MPTDPSGIVFFILCAHRSPEHLNGVTAYAGIGELAFQGFLSGVILRYLLHPIIAAVTDSYFICRMRQSLFIRHRLET
jgi:hypothetical protein